MSEKTLTFSEDSQKMNEDGFCGGMMKWDNLDSFISGLIVIWAGLVFLTNGFSSEIESWSLVFIGAGTLVLIEIAVRLLVPEYRTSILGDLICAAMLFWFGGVEIIWPVVLIVIGISVISAQLTNKKKLQNKHNQFIVH